ncbi:hypothetical protein KIN20_024647 [Parelaphostrongylus tenuis]|uniref:Uncharacterized protein n=1 Tax=Parelaphostrongylus tenuis TaxID=148309 RepID=A0AAD5QXM8_PARTN|nr:hypothetical protein KIN20_024647 [Parelaphostrongylus tenuis]
MREGRRQWRVFLYCTYRVENSLCGKLTACSTDGFNAVPSILRIPWFCGPPVLSPPDAINGSTECSRKCQRTKVLSVCLDAILPTLWQQISSVLIKLIIFDANQPVNP